MIFSAPTLRRTAEHYIYIIKYGEQNKRETGRRVHSVEMQIHTTIQCRQPELTLAMVNALRHWFINSLKIRRLADPVPLTLDLLNPKSIGFD